MEGSDPERDPDRDALEVLGRRITAIDTQLAGLTAERHALVAQYERHRWAVISRLPPAQPIAPPRAEWSGARVRALLLGLGAALLGVSALTFTAVAWSLLGDGGRALLLLAATAAVTALALALRRRLPVTAEAFAGLAVALVLVDVFAARRAGLGRDVPCDLWWAFGVIAAAGFAAVLGLVVGRRSMTFAVAALFPVAPELLVNLVDPGWVAAVILALLAAAVGYARHRLGGRLFPEARVVLAVHGVIAWLAAAVLAAIAAEGAATVAAAVGPAVAVGSLAAAPLAIRRGAALVAGVPAGVVLTMVAPWWASTAYSSPR